MPGIYHSFKIKYNEMSRQAFKKQKTNILTVIKNRGLRAAASFVILPSGESYYLHNGQKIAEESFNRKYPIEVKKISDKGENPCKKYAY